MAIVCIVVLNFCEKDFLLLTDVPNMVSLEEHIYSLTYSESLFGELFMTNDNAPYVSLKNAFDKLFFGVEINYEYCLLTIDCNAVAVLEIAIRCLIPMPETCTECHILLVLLYCLLLKVLII